MINIESIKGKIRNISKDKNLSSQEVLQMYFFERFLKRLSISKYKNNFVIKGGFLISSIIGIENRTTMDMDTTVKGIPLRKEVIKEIVEEIINVEVNDGIEFKIKEIHHIKEDDEYENFRVSLVAEIGKIKNPMKLDITTGDIITLREIEYSYKSVFNKENIKVMAYTLETVIAEKYESVIKRNITTTRMRDLYDLYILYNLKNKEIDYKILKEAITKTSIRRESLEIIKNYREILEDIKKDPYLLDLWNRYKKENKYIGNLEFDDVIKSISAISEKINEI